MANSGALGSGAVTVSGGTLDVTRAASRPVQSLSEVRGTNLFIGNVLTSSSTANLGGANVSRTASGSFIDLMNYASETGTFATSHIPSGYTLQYNATQLDLVQSASVWATAAGGSSAATPPTGPPPACPMPAALAQINAPTTTAFTITLDGPQTVGSLLLGNSASSTAGYTLSPGSAGTLTLDNSGSVATITVTDGSHVISAPVILAAA